MKRIALILGLLLASPATAQQPQQISPAEAALQINSLAGSMAQSMAQQGRIIDDMQRQIAAKDVRIKELEAKAEPKKE